MDTTALARSDSEETPASAGAPSNTVPKSGGLEIRGSLVVGPASWGAAVLSFHYPQVRRPEFSAPKARPHCSLWQRHRSLGANGLALKARYKPHVGLCDGPTAQIGLVKESYGVAIGYNVVGPLALISLRTPFEKMWVMERVPFRLRMPDDLSEYGNHFRYRNLLALPKSSAIRRVLNAPVAGVPSPQSRRGLFPLPTNPGPSRETKAALIICHPEPAKDLTPRQPASCNRSPFSKLMKSSITGGASIRRGARASCPHQPASCRRAGAGVGLHSARAQASGRMPKAAGWKPALPFGYTRIGIFGVALFELWRQVRK